jgi:hypothetical protein
MDLETPDPSHPQHQRLLREALQVVELSRVTGQVNPETLAQAQQYIQAASAEERRQDNQ